MCSGTSMEEIRYLNYLSHHDSRFKDENGVPYRMESSFFRGQVEISGYKVDGYCQTPQTKFLIEYNGCFHHDPHKGCKYNQNYDEKELENYDWFKKEAILRNWCQENQGTLIVMWGCQWDQKKVRHLETPSLPRILKPFEDKSPKHISNLVQSEKLFGFVLVDLQSPDELIKKYVELNFPPIIRKDSITMEMLSPYMMDRLEQLQRKMPSKGVQTVINSWHAEKLLVFTPLLKWYLDFGIRITKVYDIIQYQPAKYFKNFIDSCVEGRIKATLAGNQTQAQSYKICMNSSYGKLYENVSRFTTTKVSRFDNMRKEWISPRSRITELSLEVYEITLKPKSQRDDKCTLVGHSVLQYSKLLLLQFIYFLSEHLEKGSFRILYLGKNFLLFSLRDFFP